MWVCVSPLCFVTRQSYRKEGEKKKREREEIESSVVCQENIISSSLPLSVILFPILPLFSTMPSQFPSLPRPPPLYSTSPTSFSPSPSFGNGICTSVASTERARLQWVQWTRPTGSLAEQQPWPGPTSVGLITTGRPGLQRLDAWKEVERRWGS